MKKVAISCIISGLLLCLTFGADRPAQAQGGQPVPPPAVASYPSMIYVTNFAIDVRQVEPERGLLNRPRRLQQDPASKAMKLQELLASSLVKALGKKSIQAARFYPGQVLPASGWLVQGQFLEVDQGNRFQRAAIGFGVGESEMQIEVTLTDLTKTGSEPFAIFGTDSKTGKAPGASVTAVAMMNPYVAAAKFVMSKNASEKDVKKTAKQIAGIIENYIKSGGTSPR